MRIAAIVPAAGLGVRLGPGTAKALRDVAGTPLLVHAVRGLWSTSLVEAVVVAAPPQRTGEFEDVLARGVPDARVHVVGGGVTRQRSVAAGLEAVDSLGPVDAVLVHDAARAFVPVAVVERVVAGLRAGSAAVVPVLPVADTIKRVADEDVVTGTVDRSTLYAVQTPQGFRLDVLRCAYAETAVEATDDSALVEALGVPVTVVEGSEEAFKVTRPLDLLLAEALLERR
ncbi:MAG: 2-C-methyl-D-erythritol 4-phosphate cytidylyltransferase [Propionibacteriales bacterium]|nr:2-C-methyl-D-erythritol 4-phosphate cytidylyltransferase [Propionibacteriales bacterium]